MKLTATYYQTFPPQFSNYGYDYFEITIVSTSGQLNSQTGNIIDQKEMSLLILDFVNDKLRPYESPYEIGNLEYLPHTPEIFVERLWEWIEEALPFSVRLINLKVGSNLRNFVQYTREEPVLVREPQPKLQPKPQTKFRKRRKKSGRSKRKHKD